MIIFCILNLNILILGNLQMAKVVHGEESPREVLQIQVGNASSCVDK